MAISGTAMTDLIRSGSLRHGTVTALIGDGTIIPGTGIRGIGIPGIMAIHRFTGCTGRDITILEDTGVILTTPTGMDIIPPSP